MSVDIYKMFADIQQMSVDIYKMFADIQQMFAGIWQMFSNIGQMSTGILLKFTGIMEKEAFNRFLGLEAVYRLVAGIATLFSATKKAFFYWINSG